MKIITMCVWKRLAVLEKTLHALERVEGIGNYKLVIHCDGGKGSRKVFHRCQQIKFAPVELMRADQNVNHGCNESTRRVLTRGFELSDYVIHVEEDIVLAPDALVWFEWGKKLRHLPDVWNISAWRHPSGWLHLHGKPFPSGQRIQAKCKRHGGFWIWGWATWRDRWEIMRDNWTKGTDYTDSWDIHLTKVRHNLGYFAVLPLVSRAQNVGEGGVHRGGSYLDYWSGSPGFKRDDNFELLEGT